jgi:hypothetical protein
VVDTFIPTNREEAEPSDRPPVSRNESTVIPSTGWWLVVHLAYGEQYIFHNMCIRYISLVVNATPSFVYLTWIACLAAVLSDMKIFVISLPVILSLRSLRSTTSGDINSADGASETVTIRVVDDMSMFHSIPEEDASWNDDSETLNCPC